MMRFVEDCPRCLHTNLKSVILFVIFLLGALLIQCPHLWAEESDKPTTIDSSTNLLGAFSRSRVSGKPIVIVFHAVWCPYCREMKKTTFRDPAVVRLSREFEWVMVDLDRNISLAHHYDVKAVPQIQIIGPDGKLRVKIIGKIDAKKLQSELSKILEQIKFEGPVTVSKPEEFEGGERTVIVSSPDEYRANAICFSNVGYGPFHLPSQSPFQSLRLGITPQTPSTLGKGQKEIQAFTTWVNIWSTEENSFLDYENLQTNLIFAYGITDTIQIEAGWDTQSRFGGAMDGFIQGFHDLFGIDQDGRDQVPKNDFNYNIDPSVSLTDEDRGLYSSSVQATLQHNVTCGISKWPAFAYALTARYELKSDDLEGGNPWDFGLSVALSQRFSSFYLYGTVGYALFGRDSFRGIGLSDTQFTGLFAIEWRAFSTASIIVQYLFSEGVVEDLDAFSEPSHEVTLGAKWEIVRGTVLELGLIENILTSGNSPDFGVHLGVVSRF